uniref:Probable prefoldin subunit 6 n=1 Tax=Heterorhabditis bacteriophora TaxID=37862 RepID=A0A1I7XLG2_HETBA
MSDTLKAKFEEELNKFKQVEKDREKYISNRQQLESQLTENNLVKTEFDLLDEDARVYKLIGAVLVRQDLAEARANVDKRLEYISAEIKRVDDNLSDFAEKTKIHKEKLVALQESFKRSQ